MKRYFEEATLPEYCYPQEAVLWRGLGRLPSSIYYDGQEDARSEFNEGKPIADWSFGYSPREFAGYDIAIDSERYDVGSDPLLKKHHILQSLSPDLTETQKAYYRSQIREEEWRESMDAQMSAVLESHRLAVLEALASGRLHASGHPVPREIEEGTGEWPDALLTPIPRLAWTMKGYDWDASKLTLPDHSVYRCVVLELEEVLDLWPLPLIPTKERVGIMAGEQTMILDDEVTDEGSQTLSHPRRPGAPAKGALSAREAACNFFDQRIRKNEKGDSEALYQSIVEFVQKSYRFSIARSTAQAWCDRHRRLSGSAPVIKPVIRADNPSAPN